MNEKKYFKLTPFKLQVLQSFPFIDADFDALTNYELLCKVVEYLNLTIDNVNNIEDNLDELNANFITLKNYVDNYFDNLDVQDEINNKLDEMAESGELTDIIAQYLGLAGVFGYDTIADMSDALNLADGSICRCLGQNTYNDGKGAFYKVRQVTVDDTIDGFNIVALLAGNTIIAERLPNYYINAINTTLNIMNTRKAIIIGDSYANRTNSWADRLQAMLNLSNSNCVIKRVSGVGFYATQNNVNFSTMVVDNISIPANEVTDIIVCGGYNDRNATDTQLNEAFSNFVTICNTTYPNAKIYVGFIGWANLDVGTANEWSDIVNTLALARLRYINMCCDHPKVYYLNNVEYTLHDVSLIDDSGFHPTDDGQNKLAENIKQAYETGSCNVLSMQVNLTSNLELESYITEITSGTIYGSIENGRSRLWGNNALYLTFDQTTSFNLSNDITIGTLDAGFVQGRANSVTCSVAVLVNTKNNSYFAVPGILYISGGIVKLRARTLNRNGTNWVTDSIKYIQVDGINITCDSMFQY